MAEIAGGSRGVRGVSGAVPVAARRWPLVGHVFSLLRDPHRFMTSLSVRGDVVCIYLGTLPVYVPTTPELVHQVLATDANKFEKGMLFQRLRPLLGNGLAVSGGDYYRRQRRLVQPSFQRVRIARYAEIMSELAGELVSSWKPEQVVGVDRSMQDLAIAVAGRALFSTDLDTRVTSEIQRSVPVLLQDGSARALTPKLLEKLPISWNRRFDEAIGQLRRMVSELVRTMRTDDVRPDDLLSALISARDEETGESMNDQQVLDEVVTLLIAGTQTTALALAWLFHELARHPEVERRLHAEIDEVLGGRRRATFDDLPALTYTRQVANEVLRRYAPWLLMRRTTEEVALDGLVLPADTEVAVSPYTLHHDSRYFPEPNRFDPRRWAPDRDAGLPRKAFLPFGSGLHHCPGHSFAHAEIAITVATVGSHYKLVPVPGRRVRMKMTAGMPYPSQLAMRVIPRSR
ncbi:cytochrome P450 [Longimycelium tulufanense]|uniref:Cytochrome P450 n=1 Tax=Longimycelium tulufanense TaxID=907463 RepID=A0A8J3C7A6_9PSEU|nr:cytochrome P450 [Longimycelium tulufanense]GGM34042.1 cytochrome P450 [Longimycelium tulufanense]